MLELPHTLAGALIGSKFPNPLVAIPLAFFSHFFLDFIPHWNPHLYTEMKKFGQTTAVSKIIVVLDVAISIVAGMIIALRFFPDWSRILIILYCCFAAVSLDVIEGFYFFLGIRHPFLEGLIRFQLNHQGRASLITGLIVQAATIVIILALIGQ